MCAGYCTAGCKALNANLLKQEQRKYLRTRRRLRESIPCHGCGHFMNFPLNSHREAITGRLDYVLLPRRQSRKQLLYFRLAYSL